MSYNCYYKFYKTLNTLKYVRYDYCVIAQNKRWVGGLYVLKKKKVKLTTEKKQSRQIRITVFIHNRTFLVRVGDISDEFGRDCYATEASKRYD